MARNGYGDRCGIARALDVVGDRWALLVVRELLLGPKRFTDLQAGLPTAGPDMLAARLRDLEAAGVLARTTTPPPTPAKLYGLTPRGAALEPALLALGAWGAGVAPDEDAVFGPDAFVLALKTRYVPQRGPAVELRLPDLPYALRPAGAALEAARGPAARPRAVLTATPAAFARALWHDGDRGAITVEGDRAAAQRFLAAFPRP